MAVRLTCPHPKHGNPGTLVSLDDPQAERDLITAGYAVEAYTRKASPAKATPRKAAKPRKAAPAAKPSSADE